MLEGRCPLVSFVSRTILSLSIAPTRHHIHNQASHTQMPLPPQGVTLQESSAPPPPVSRNRSNGAAAKFGAVTKATKPTVLPLSSATPATAGAKSAACADLAKLEAKGGFRTPAGCVLPFGAMDIAIKVRFLWLAALWRCGCLVGWMPCSNSTVGFTKVAASLALQNHYCKFGNKDHTVLWHEQAAGQEQEYTRLVEAIDAADLTSLDALCGELHALVAATRPDAASLSEIGMQIIPMDWWRAPVPLPESTFSCVCVLCIATHSTHVTAAAFDGVRSVIVRSSSNVEDLAGMSGAGLYESIGNVTVRCGWPMKKNLKWHPTCSSLEMPRHWAAQ